MKPNDHRSVRRAAGLCIFCTKRALVGFVMCARHREINRLHVAKIYQRRRKAGICKCGKPAIPAMAMCPECREYNRQYLADRRAKPIDNQTDERKIVS